MKKKKKIVINKSKFKMVSIIAIVAVILIVSLTIFPNTFSKYISSGDSELKVNIAFSLLNVEDLNTTIKLDEILPNDQYQEYTFAVKNFDDVGDRIDVKMKYRVVLRTTTNIPISYELYNGDNTPLSVTSETITDDYGTIFNKYTSNYIQVPFNVNQTNTFKLKYKLSSAYKAEAYSDLSDLIEVKVEAEQVI